MSEVLWAPSPPFGNPAAWFRLRAQSPGDCEHPSSSQAGCPRSTEGKQDLSQDPEGEEGRKAQGQWELEPGRASESSSRAVGAATTGLGT